MYLKYKKQKDKSGQLVHGQKLKKITLRPIIATASVGNPDQNGQSQDWESRAKRAGNREIPKIFPGGNPENLEFLS